MRIGVVTPVRNGAEWIASTITSVLDQAVFSNTHDSEVSLVYVIQDGLSTDSTVALASQAFSELSDPRVSTHVASKADGGMYSALAAGFETIAALGGADWYTYINAGDLWDRNCLSVLSKVNQHPRIDWLMGLHAYYSPDGSLVHTRLPPRYKRELLHTGAYGRGLPTVQQESTFWRANLHDRVMWSTVANHLTAGDAYLWWALSEFSEPFIIEALLGGFRYHGNHLGVSKVDYQAEVSSFAGDIPLTTRALIAAERALWEQPARIKSRMNPKLLRFRTDLAAWANQDRSIVIS